MTKKKIVVIGGGVAGVHATRELSKKLKANADITLIDKHSYHTSMTQLHEVAAGRVPFTTVQYDFQKLLGKRKNVSLVTDAVVSLDKDNKKVITEQGSYDYDYVVVALGGEPNDFGVPGVKEHGLVLKNTVLLFGHSKMLCVSNVNLKLLFNMVQQKLTMKNAVHF